jgi:hypothetical protein
MTRRSRKETRHRFDERDEQATAVEPRRGHRPVGLEEGAGERRGDQNCES